MHDQFLRLSEVSQRVGLSRSTIWRQERTGSFPKRRKISRNAVAWLQSEIEAWITSREHATQPAKGGGHVQ